MKESNNHEFGTVTNMHGVKTKLQKPYDEGAKQIVTLSSTFHTVTNHDRREAKGDIGGS